MSNALITAWLVTGNNDFLFWYLAGGVVLFFIVVLVWIWLNTRGGF